MGVELPEDSDEDKEVITIQFSANDGANVYCKKRLNAYDDDLWKQKS